MTTRHPRLQLNVGAGLRRWRQRNGLSQDQAARVLGFHRSRIGHIEQGGQNLTLQTVEDLADQLDVEPLDLLAGLPD